MTFIEIITNRLNELNKILQRLEERIRRHEGHDLEQNFKEDFRMLIHTKTVNEQILNELLKKAMK